MKITIKNLQQQTFCIDFDNSKTVKALKEAIFEDRGGDYTVDRQKLIYAGIILDDERTLASYDVSEKKFIVVMLKRDIAAATTTTTAAKEDTKTTTKENTKDDETKTKESDKSTTAAATTTTASPTTTTTTTGASGVTASSGLVMGDEYQRSVNSMIEMGYSREMVERAMAASFNNPERAVEYLISGIPENTEFGGFGGVDATGDAVNSPNSGTARATAGEDPFEFLRNQPQFLQMRSLVYQNPDLLQAVLRQIGNTNPALLQLISENQDAFLNMLNQPLDSTETPESPTAASVAAALGGGSSTAAGGGNRRAQMEAVTRAISGGGNTAAAAAASAVSESTPATTETQPAGNPQTITLSLTANDKQAIERLKAMGFPEALVLQAYFACEKDEQLAANFLISSAFDD